MCSITIRIIAFKFKKSNYKNNNIIFIAINTLKF